MSETLIAIIGTGTSPATHLNKTTTEKQTSNSVYWTQVTKNSL